MDLEALADCSELVLRLSENGQSKWQIKYLEQKLKKKLIEGVQIDEMCIQVKKGTIKDGSGLLMMKQEGKYWIFRLEVEAQKN